MLVKCFVIELVIARWKQITILWFTYFSILLFAKSSILLFAYSSVLLFAYRVICLCCKLDWSYLASGACWLNYSPSSWPAFPIRLSHNSDTSEVNYNFNKESIKSWSLLLISNFTNCFLLSSCTHFFKMLTREMKWRRDSNGGLSIIGSKIAKLSGWRWRVVVVVGGECTKGRTHVCKTREGCINAN